MTNPRYASPTPGLEPSFWAKSVLLSAIEGNNLFRVHGGRMMPRQVISLIFLMVLIFIPAMSWGWQGQVVDISNGDAITVLHDGREEKVFLYGIKCPGQQQNFGPESKNFTSQMVTGRIVEVRPMLVDSNGRTIVIVSVDGMSLNEELVKAGLASVLVQYCRDTSCLMWIRNQEEAQIKKIGLWSTENPTPPSEFRRENKSLGKHTAKFFQSEADIRRGPWGYCHSRFPFTWLQKLRLSKHA